VNENLRYMKEVRARYRLTHRELAALSEYGLDSVKGWFSTSPGRKVNVPDRAVAIVKLKLEKRERT